jgi:hypothetical protein
VDGESAVGGTLSFRFGKPEPSAVMEVVSLVPTERVEWRCVKGPDEWIDTTVTFDLAEASGCCSPMPAGGTGRVNAPLQQRLGALPDGPQSRHRARQSHPVARRPRQPMGMTR